MQRWLVKGFLLSVIPWLVLLGFVTNLWFQETSHLSPIGGTSTHGNSLIFATLAFVTFDALVVTLLTLLLVKKALKPFTSFLKQVNLVSSQQEILSPQVTGLAEIDIALKRLLTHAKKSQQRLDAERTLAADVSHQLRSPLTALSLRLEQIAQNTRNTTVQADSVAALGQVDRLVRLVEGLFTNWRSTIDRNLTQIHLTEFLEDVKLRWQTRVLSESRSIEVRCKNNLVALGTREVQELVLSILIENSIQHGAGKIIITAREYQSWILIEVSDEGKGIASEIEETLMAKGATTSGTGLGLAWARNQVASDGGRLELRNVKPAVFGIFLMSAGSASI